SRNVPAGYRGVITDGVDAAVEGKAMINARCRRGVRGSRQVVGRDKVGMELRPVVIIIQSPRVIRRESTYAAKLGTIATPFTVNKAVAQARFRIVIPIVDTAPEAIARVFYEGATCIGGVKKNFFIRAKVSVIIAGEP